MIDKYLNMAVSDYLPDDLTALKIKEKIIKDNGVTSKNYFDCYFKVAKIFEQAFAPMKAIKVPCRSNFIYGE